MSMYSQGADIERKHCHVAVSGGALVALRGAGSKSYSRDGYKIDTVFIYQDKVVLAQHKKRGAIEKRDLVKLWELQNTLPGFFEVCVGTSSEIMPVRKLIGDIFK